MRCSQRYNEKPSLLPKHALHDHQFQLTSLHAINTTIKISGSCMPVAHGLLHARPCLPRHPLRCTCSTQQHTPAIRVSDVSLAFAGSPGTGQTRKQVWAP